VTEVVRPVDIADHLAKTPAAEKVNQIQKAAPDMDQRQFALQLEGKMIQKQQQPTPTTKTDEVIIHREKQQQREKKRKKSEDKKKKSEIHLDLKA
jgi:hypothetical protein